MQNTVSSLAHAPPWLQRLALLQFILSVNYPRAGTGSGHVKIAWPVLRAVPGRGWTHHGYGSDRPATHITQPPAPTGPHGQNPFSQRPCAGWSRNL
eukprot:6173368-Pleurochrysis_carterae.AAC.4